MNGKVWTVVLAMTAAGAAATAAEQELVVAFETILKESDGGPTEATEIGIQSENEWVDFIKSCTSDTTRNTLRKQKLDFENETIVVVCPGKNSSILGHADYEKQSGVQKVHWVNDKLTVEYNVVFSDHQDTKDKYPIHVVKLPKEKSVSFRKGKKVFGG